jgi:hypothetical protein
MKITAKLAVWGLGLAVASLSACSGSGRPKSTTGGQGGDETGGTGDGTGGSGGSAGSGAGGVAGTSGTGGVAGTSGAGGGDTGGVAGTSGTGGTGGDGGSAPEDAGVEPDAALEPDASRPDAAPPVPAPAPWLGKDIGAVGMLAGYENTSAADNDSQRITVYGGGTTGIGGKADAFHFVSRPMTGDAELIGRVTSLGMVDPNTTAGLMIRESLDPDAAMVFLGPIGDGKTGGRVVVRKQKGQAALVTPTDPTAAPLAELKTSQWMRLVRTGATVRIFAGTRLGVSDDSASLGSVTLTLAKATSPLYFGMASTSNSDMKPASGRFEDVTISNLSTDSQTAKWTTHTFGISGGSALWSKNDLAITGLGQPWSTVMDKSRDFFQYAFFRPDVKPDSQTSLQFLVTDQGKTNPGGRVSAMYRVAADMNGFNRSNATVALSLTQETGLVLEVRTVAGEKSPLVATEMKADLKAPLWLRLDRQLAPFPADPLGRLFTQVRAYYAADNKGAPGRWNSFGAVTSFESVGPADFATLGIAVGSFAPLVPNTGVVSKVVVGSAPTPPPPTLDGGPTGPAVDGGSTD